MSYIIQLRRGLKANLPASAPAGEAFLTTDTHELFVGTDTGMVEIVSAAGSGNATSIAGTPVLAQAPSNGEILIFDGPSGKYVPGDPIVSGPDAPGTPPTRPPVQAGVFDGTNVQRLKGDAQGNANVNVQNFPATQPVSAASLPLPAGASTEATLAAIKAKTDNLDVALSTRTKPSDTQPISATALPLPAGAATEASLGTDGAAPPSIPGTGIRGWLRSIYDALKATLTVSVSNFPATQPVSAAALPLPAGAATEASLGTDGAAPPSIPGTGIRGWLRSIYDTLKATLTVSVSNFPATQPVSGTVTANAGTNLNTSALAVETGGNLAAAKADLDAMASAISGGVSQDNIKNWGGTAVSAPPGSGVPPAGTEVSPVVKPIQRKSQDLFSTANILASATYASAWFDSQQTGASQAVLSVLIPSSGFGSNALKFDTTDDPTQANFVSQLFTPQINIYNSFWVPIQGRFWRVRFQNGATQQTGPIIAVTTQAFPKTLNPSMGANLNDGLLQVLQSGSLTDTLNAGAWSNANFGAGAAAASAQYVSTSGPQAGANWAAIRTPVVFKPIAAVAVTAGTPVAVWTPAAGKKFRVMGYALSLSVAGSVILKDATTEILRTPLMAAGIGQPAPRMGNGILSATANNVLNADVSATGSISGFVFGTEE
jgi:hypothetical protein